MLSPYIEAHELRELVLKKEVRPREVAEFFLARVEKLNPKLGAFMTVTAERALADAARLEKMSAAERSRCRCSGLRIRSRICSGRKIFAPRSDRRITRTGMRPRTRKLRCGCANAGGILLGKTTTPEFGLRPTTEGGLCPPARNPWNLEHTAGGSSGGSASAVAAGLHPVAQGSDGGGSVRIPAACCGLVGIKPSRGRITRAPSEGESWGGLSTTGPIARTVRDAALMLDAMAGMMPGDPYAARPPYASIRRGGRGASEKTPARGDQSRARSAPSSRKLSPRSSPHAACFARWGIASSRSRSIRARCSANLRA